MASIWTRSICQMQATFPGVELVRILFNFKKRKENSSSYVHVLRKRQIRTFRSRAKKRDARALNLLLFEVVIIVVVVCNYNSARRNGKEQIWRRLRHLRELVHKELQLPHQQYVNNLLDIDQGLEGYFRDSGFDQNTVRESGKR